MRSRRKASPPLRSRVTARVLWLGLALVALPVAAWWLATLRSPAPVAYLPAALPLLLVARAFVAGRLGPALSGLVAGVSVLGATGAGIVFVPIGLGAVALEAISREAAGGLVARTLAFFIGYIAALGLALLLQSYTR